MRPRALIASILLAATAAILALSGCSKKIHAVGNMPPETYVFVQGPIDTVNHRVHLYWYGTDPDGSVSAYAIRWVYASQLADTVKWDTIRCAGNPTPRDSMFTMFTGDSAVVSPRFEVFAIDNEGAADATPAVQRFELSNTAPVVSITNALTYRDSTYASVTFSWTTTDPDGGGPGLHYRVWLDGNESAMDSTSAQTFTVPSSRFLKDGTFASGLRTVYLQAVDDGGRQGPVTSFTWFVRAPADIMVNNQGNLLVIDDVRHDTGNNIFFDKWYWGGMFNTTRLFGVSDWLPAGTYDTLFVEYNSNIFRSNADIEQTFKQFKAVLWYRGDNLTTSTWLSYYADGIGAYLDSGGKLYLDGVYVVQGLRTPGSLSESFVSSRLGSDGMYNCYSNYDGSLVDSTAGWGNKSTTIFRSSVYPESFKANIAAPIVSGGSGGLRGFVVRDTSYVALWAMDGTLSPANTGFEVPIAVTVPQGAGGRIVLSTFPVPYGKLPASSNWLHRVLFAFGIDATAP